LQILGENKNEMMLQGPTTPKPPCEAPACPNDTLCEKEVRMIIINILIDFNTLLAEKFLHSAPRRENKVPNKYVQIQK
jgi:hypothetical protein